MNLVLIFSFSEAFSSDWEGSEGSLAYSSESSEFLFY